MMVLREPDQTLQAFSWDEGFESCCLISNQLVDTRVIASITNHCWLQKWISHSFLARDKWGKFSVKQKFKVSPEAVHNTGASQWSFSGLKNFEYWVSYTKRLFHCYPTRDVDIFPVLTSGQSKWRNTTSQTSLPPLQAASVWGVWICMRSSKRQCTTNSDHTGSHKLRLVELLIAREIANLRRFCCDIVGWSFQVLHTVIITRKLVDRNEKKVV